MSETTTRSPDDDSIVAPTMVNGFSSSHSPGSTTVATKSYSSNGNNLNGVATAAAPVANNAVEAAAVGRSVTQPNHGDDPLAEDDKSAIVGDPLSTSPRQCQSALSSTQISNDNEQTDVTIEKLHTNVLKTEDQVESSHAQAVLSDLSDHNDNDGEEEEEEEDDDEEEEEEEELEAKIMSPQTETISKNICGTDISKLCNVESDIEISPTKTNTSNSVHSDRELEKDEIIVHSDDIPQDEPDEIPCLLPFISTDVAENMVDPLMDTDESAAAWPSNTCHNRAEKKKGGNDDSSSVEFVSEDNAPVEGETVIGTPKPEDSNDGSGILRKRRRTILRCSECCQLFDSETELGLHTETLDVALLCAQCDSSFWSPCALNQHRREHVTSVSHLSSASGYRRNAFSLHSQAANDKALMCIHCGTGFSTRFNLTRHIRKNVIWLKNEEPYRCDQCDATFLAKCMLPIHKMEQHFDARNQPPEILQNSFSNGINASIDEDAESDIVTPQFDLLEREFEQLEEESRPVSANCHTFRTATEQGIKYNCKWCPEKVPTHPALVKHIKATHPEVQLYHCEPCNKTFLNKAGLYGHLTHHRYQCDECGLTFSSNDSLYEHRNIHADVPSPPRPVKAEDSTSQPAPASTAPTSSKPSPPPPPPPAPPSPSPSSSSLPSSSPKVGTAPPRFGGTRVPKPKCDGIPYFELLAMVPTMSKPFRCQFCDKEFMYKTLYLEHYLTHTGERPFRCNVCNQGFIRERAMEIHQTSHGIPFPPHKAKSGSATATLAMENLESTLSLGRMTRSANSPCPANSPRPATSPRPPNPTYPQKKVARKSTNPDKWPSNRINLVGGAVVDDALFDPQIEGKRRVARKSTNSDKRPSNRINPVGRAVINNALFDMEIDVTPEDMNAFYYLPTLALRMTDISSLTDHAYVCPYCDKFFPRPSSMCGHRKICSYLTRKRAECPPGTKLPFGPRKLGTRAGRGRKMATPSSSSSHKMHYHRANDTSVVIANMRHHIIFEKGERIFVCGVCGKRFARKFTLGEHCRSHTTDRPFLCEHCSRAFKRKSSLFRHRRRNHTRISGGFGLPFPIAEVDPLSHQTLVEQNWMSFEPQCNVKVELSGGDDDDDDDDSVGDEDFKPIIHLTEVENYTDPESNLQFDDGMHDVCEFGEMSVFEPQCIVKDEAASDTDGEGDGMQAASANAGPSYYPAAAESGDGLIDASMNHFLEVDLARRSSPSQPLPKEGESGDDAETEWSADADYGLSYEQRQLPLQAAATEALRFLCGECNRRFPRREDLRRHYLEHSSLGPYKCYFCDKTFDRRKYLSKHARNHCKKKSYQCAFCERAFVTNAELTIHVRIHTGERPFQCSECGKGFRIQKQLTLHYRTHTGEKPYSCVRCSATFSRHETLFRHNRVCQTRHQSQLAMAAAVAASAAGAYPPQQSVPAGTPQLSQLLRQPSSFARPAVAQATQPASPSE